MRIWELEFLVEDVDLTASSPAPSPAGALRAATDDRPARSTRYREVLGPNGIGDELWAVLRADGEPWASIGLYGEEGRPAFSPEDAELVATLSHPLGHAVRGHARYEANPPVTEDGVGPGLMLFSSDGELLLINDDVRAWLEELMPGHVDICGAFGVELPMVVAATLMPRRRSPRNAITGARGRACARLPAAGSSATPPACKTPMACSATPRSSSSRLNPPRSPRSSSRPTG